MGRDTAGAWTRVHDWTTDKSNSIKITASRFDADMDDMASGLSASAETTKVAEGTYHYMASITGNTSQNSISASIALAYTAYATGQANWFLPGWNNTGSTTMTISGLSAASLQAGGAALTSGMLLSGIPAGIISDGSGLHLMNPQRAPANFSVAGSYSASSVATADIQDRAVTIAKLDSGTTQGALIQHTASGVAAYITATTSGLPLVTKGASVDAAFQEIGVIGIADRAIEIAKFGSDTTQGSVIGHTASGVAAYIVATTSGLPLVTKGASVDAAFQEIGENGIADNSIKLEHIQHETTQGAFLSFGASGTPQYITATTSGLPLVTLGASVDAAFQKISTAGLVDTFIADYASAAPAGGDFVLFADITDSNNVKRTTADQIGGTITGITDNSTESAITISADEEVSIPKQPAHESFLSTAQTNVTGDNTTFTFTGSIFTETYDQNADFLDGTFTAPVSGRYLFHATMAMDGITSNHDKVIINLITSNASRQVNMTHGANYSNAGVSGRWNSAVVMDMDAADTAHYTIQVNATDKTVDFAINNTTMSATLLC